MSKVPYRDPVQPSTDLAEGRIEFYWGAFAIVRPQVQAGKARLIAFSNTKRFPDEPNVPTVAEAGYPDAQLRRPRRPVRAARARARHSRTHRCRRDGGRRRSRDLGAAAHHRPGRQPRQPAEFAAEIDKQRAIVAVIAKELGIKPAVKSQ